MDKRLKKDDIGIAKHYQGLTLTSIVAKIYNALLLNCIESETEKILWKNENGFWRNRSTTLQILIIQQIIEGVHAKNLKATLNFVYFSNAFNSIHRGKMTQILLAYGLLKEIMMLCKSTKVKVCSLDRDIEFFDIVASVLQGNTLAPYQFIICQDYILRTSIDLMKENNFTLKKTRNRWYPTQTIMDADFADDRALLANTPTQAESLEQATGGIGLHVNANKTKYMWVNQKADISTLNGGSLKLLDKFMYLSSSVSTTENDINMHLAKSWTTIDWLSIIWKSDLSDKIKRNCFPSSNHVNSTIWMHHMDADLAYKEKNLMRTAQECYDYIEQILETTSYKTAAELPPTSHL